MIRVKITNEGATLPRMTPVEVSPNKGYERGDFFKSGGAKPSWSRFGGGAALIERHNIGRVSIVGRDQRHGRLRAQIILARPMPSGLTR
jgi:hypothetical protein